jgi:hypothetical protein
MASDTASTLSDHVDEMTSSADEHAEQVGEHGHGEGETFLEKAKDMLGGLFGGGGAEKTDAS